MRDFNSSSIIVKLIDGTTIKGKINLRRSQRLSDLFKEGSDQYLTLFDINVPEGSEKVIFLNKNQIIWAMPLDPV
ncbi:MAG: hypothetical protein Q8P24_16910 [Desulfobacterales bacterium]|nr:hypothetical protein [Desulfobacterales bacterium]